MKLDIYKLDFTEFENKLFIKSNTNNEIIIGLCELLNEMREIKYISYVVSELNKFKNGEITNLEFMSNGDSTTLIIKKENTEVKTEIFHEDRIESISKLFKTDEIILLLEEWHSFISLKL